MKARRPYLIKALNEIGSFYMEMKWEFSSWIPFVSRSLPSDVSKIYKKGCNIRLDSTLSGFDDFKWEHGDISFLFLGNPRLTLLYLLGYTQTVTDSVTDCCK